MVDVGDLDPANEGEVKSKPLTYVDPVQQQVDAQALLNGIHTLLNAHLPTEIEAIRKIQTFSVPLARKAHTEVAGMLMRKIFNGTEAFVWTWLATASHPERLDGDNRWGDQIHLDPVENPNGPNQITGETVIMFHSHPWDEYISIQNPGETSAAKIDIRPWDADDDDIHAASIVAQSMTGENSLRAQQYAEDLRNHAAPTTKEDLPAPVFLIGVPAVDWQGRPKLEYPDGLAIIDGKSILRKDEPLPSASPWLNALRKRTEARYAAAAVGIAIRSLVLAVMFPYVGEN